MKKVFYVLIFIPLFFIACSENTDPMDAYTGKWNYVSTGSKIYTQNNGMPLYTVPTDTTSIIYVINQGSNVLNVGGLTAQVSGSTLTIASVLDSTTVSGMTKKINISFQGTITTNKIVISESYSGIWTTQGLSGTISGNTLYTFTR